MNTRNQYFINVFRSIKLRYIDNLNKISRFANIAPKKDNPTPLLLTQDSSFVLKAMRADQLRKSLSVWPIQTIHQDRAVFGENPNGWYVSYKDNELVGYCTSIAKSRNTAWLGYLYVEPQHRKKGYGSMTLQRLRDHDTSNGITHHTYVCLEDLVPVYQTKGFEVDSQDYIFHTQRSFNITSSIPRMPLTPLAMSQALYNELIAYDKGIQLGYNRESFLMPWISKDNTQVVIATEYDKIVGYNVISDFQFPMEGGTQIHQRMAPLYADDPEVAELLVLAGLESKNKPIMFLDADGNNPNARSVVTQFSFFNELIRLARMSHPTKPLYYDTDRVISPSHYGNGP